MPDRVIVRVPATVANVGPGFDCLGFALAWHDEVRVERGGGRLQVSVSGAGAERIPRDGTNLVARGLAAVLGGLDGLRVNQMNAIAYGRGFGSSAAAIVAGLVAGRTLAGSDHTDEDLLAMATELEGHADNVAPCLLGGVTVVAGARVVRLDPPPSVCPLVCVAPGQQSTAAARAALPDAVARADAVWTVGRAALLVAALAAGRPDVLLDATEDRLHQPARFELMPDAGALVRALRAAGIAAFLSGAGPSVCALVAGDAREAEAEARRAAPEGWEVRLEGFDASGATVVEAAGD